jgi:hypothetical protein
MQKWQGFFMHVVCHSMFSAPLIGIPWLKPSTKPPLDTRAPYMKRLELCYLTKKKQKSKELLHGLQMGGDVGVSIVSDGWTNVRDQHLINILGVSSTGAVFLGAHDSSSVMASSQNIADILAMTHVDNWWITFFIP